MRQIFLAALFLAGPLALGAQWRATLLTGNIASHGDARSDSDPDQPELRADRPATLRLALSHEAQGWRVGVDIHHIGADLAEVSATSAVTTRSVLSAWGAGVEIARRIAGGDHAAALFAGGGMTFDRWSFDLADAAARWRPAARGSLETDFPVGQQWSAAVRGELWAGPSVFTAEEIPDGFSRRAAVRVGLLLGVTRLF